MAEEGSTIFRSALGRTAAIGDFYDVRRDILLQRSIFRRPPPDSVLRFTNNSVTHQEFFVSDKFTQRLDGFGTQSELALSVVGRLVKPLGAAEYLLEQRSRPGDSQWTLSQKISKQQATIDIHDETLKEFINPEAISDEATHVVVGIEWGAQTFATFTQHSHGLDTGQWKANFSNFMADFSQKLLQVVGELNLNATEIDRERLTDFTFKVFADMTDAPISPGNIVDTLDILRKMPERVVTTGDGKGVQLQFHLLPLTEVAKAACIAFSPKSLQIVSKKAVKQIIEKVDELEVRMTELSEYGTALHQFTLPELKQQEAQTFIHECHAEKKQWEESLGKELVEYRDSEEGDEIELLLLVRNLFKNSKLSQISTVVNDPTLKERQALTNQFLALQVHLKGQDLSRIRQTNFDKEVFVLFYSYQRDHAAAVFKDTLKTFLEIAEQFPRGGFVAIDEDAFPQLREKDGVPDGLRIAVIQNGAYVCTDYMKVLRIRQTECTVLCQAPIFSGPMNPQCMPLEVPCPRFARHKLCCGIVHRWHCYQCLRIVEYDFKGHLYCDCGSQSIENFGFHCVDTSHGEQLELFGPEMIPYLNQMKRMKELVILVIGETGVGKSTWINAIANYITHENWKEACEDRLLNLIPTSFSLSAPTDEGTREITVSVGNESGNEAVGAKGQSATQHPKSYVFTHNYTAYRIVDTPGIGDTRGLEMDKQNIQEILSFMAQFKAIHMICFLMLPDVSRITERFQFCFKELIKQFHYTAARNIVFCFTNASSTGFHIGQTNTYLKNFVESIKQAQNVEISLNKHTEFIFDNMAYRYLCAMHQKVDRSVFTHIEDLYEKSFEHSRTETLRLLDHARSVTPHNPEQTLSLNYARNLILKLSNPLVRINTAVRKTLTDIEEKTAELLKYQNNDKELSKRLNREIIITRFKVTLKSGMVCKNCSELKSYFGKDRDPFIECDPSVASENPFKIWTGGTVEPDTYGNYSCQNCGPDFPQVPTGRTFTSFTESKLEEDTNVRSLMKANASSKDILQAKLKDLERKRRQIEREYTKLTQASAKFAIFLQQNCITPYNDATEMYLNQLIALEKERSRSVTEKQQRYQLMLAEYIQEKRVLEKSLTDATKLNREVQITPAEVEKLAKELQQMPFYGEDVYNALHTVQQCTQLETEQDTYYAPSPKRGLVERGVRFIKRTFSPW